MTAFVDIDLDSVGLLVGVRGVSIQVDGDVRETAQFGQASRVEVTPGDHAVQVVLHGVVDRSSNTVTVRAEQGRPGRVRGSYDRLTGAIVLHAAPDGGP